MGSRLAEVTEAANIDHKPETVLETPERLEMALACGISVPALTSYSAQHAAGASGSMEVIQRLLQRGMPISNAVLVGAASARRTGTLYRLPALALEHGLQWLHQAGCPHDIKALCEVSLDDPMMKLAPPQMEWLRGIGGSWSREQLAIAGMEAISLAAERNAMLLVLDDICPSSSSGVKVLAYALEAMGNRLSEITEVARNEDASLRASARSRSDTERGSMDVVRRARQFWAIGSLRTSDAFVDGAARAWHTGVIHQLPALAVESGEQHGRLAALKFLMHKDHGQALFGPFIWDTSGVDFRTKPNAMDPGTLLEVQNS
ncbi:hypothetical protein JKP88DRAFT_279050 [Tribonema minus]|uniref:Uncharacterized protein n=1 Tax=Tribonema minus TaxID=303371 RepID=A0A836CD13_9STRA|nr:hypothetical protein JKP88DRAFT_279050 [Tribonema minus]